MTTAIRTTAGRTGLRSKLADRVHFWRTDNEGLNFGLSHGASVDCRRGCAPNVRRRDEKCNPRIAGLRWFHYGRAFGRTSLSATARTIIASDGCALSGPSSNVYEAAMASEPPSRLKASAEIVVAYGGSCVSLFLADQSHKLTVPSPPPARTAWWRGWQ